MHRFFGLKKFLHPISCLFFLQEGKYMSDDWLSDILDEHEDSLRAEERRKSQEREAYLQRLSTFRHDFDELVNNMIMPSFTAVREMLNDRGYPCEIKTTMVQYEREKNESFAKITLFFENTIGFGAAKNRSVIKSPYARSFLVMAEDEKLSIRVNAYPYPGAEAVISKAFTLEDLTKANLEECLRGFLRESLKVEKKEE